MSSYTDISLTKDEAKELKMIIENDLKKRFISRLIKSNKEFGRKLAWFPDGEVLETVASRFYYMCKGEINALLEENKGLRTDINTIEKAFNDVSTILERMSRETK